MEEKAYKNYVLNLAEGLKLVSRLMHQKIWFIKSVLTKKKRLTFDQIQQKNI